MYVRVYANMDTLGSPYLRICLHASIHCMLPNQGSLLYGGITRSEWMNDWLIPSKNKSSLPKTEDTAASVIRSSHTSYAASSSSSSSGWGCFSFASRSDYSSSYSAQRSYSASFQASSSASGLKIAIPGVQVIGYYTRVVDKFPKDENA